jgi:uncharacterized coiled-coil DUF342 family protein
MNEDSIIWKIGTLEEEYDELSEVLENIQERMSEVSQQIDELRKEQKKWSQT